MTQGWMVDLQRFGILPEAHLYSRQWRGVRDVLRQRSRWVRERTRALLSLQSRYARCRGWNLGKSDLFSGPLPDLGDAEQNWAAGSQVRIIRSLNEEIEILEKRVYKRLALEEECHRRLMEIPGIGPVLASTIVLETGDLSRFRRVGKYASYARVVKSGQWTNHRKKGPGNRRSGNRYLDFSIVISLRNSPETLNWSGDPEGS